VLGPPEPRTCREAASSKSFWEISPDQYRETRQGPAIHSTSCRRLVELPNPLASSLETALAELRPDQPQLALPPLSRSLPPGAMAATPLLPRLAVHTGMLPAAKSPRHPRWASTRRQSADSRRLAHRARAAHRAQTALMQLPASVWRPLARQIACRIPGSGSYRLGFPYPPIPSATVTTSCSSFPNLKPSPSKQNNTH
jgi:hypothetical protein